MTAAKQQEWITTVEAAELLGAHVDNARKALISMECETREPRSKGSVVLWRRADVLAVRDLRKFQRRTTAPRAYTAGPRTYDGPDHCGPNGAARLKARIEAYWRERGHTVTVELIETPAPAGTPRVDIRSNMVDGLPVK